MKKLVVNFVLVMAVLGISASATPIYTPFLSVDLNGGRKNSDGSGPTQPGWSNWSFVDSWSTIGTPVSKSFDGVTISITPYGADVNSVDRKGPSDDFGLLDRDFIYVTRDANIGLGRHYLKFDFSGLIAGTPYEFTFFGYDQNNSGNASFMAWGIEDPSAYPDYQPVAGGSGLAPKLARACISGPKSSNYSDPEYHYSASFIAAASNSGTATIYGWNDSDSYSDTQLVSMANGFQVGVVPISSIPEPATIGILILGVLSLIVKKK